MSKKIIIIGGSGSIGSAIAKEILKENFEPYLIGRNFFELNKLSKELKCEFKKADVGNTEELKKAIQDCGNSIFGLAYCVGSINLKPVSTAHENDYLDSFKINTLGAINAVKFSMNFLKQNHGSILFFSSIAVKQGFPNHTIISSAKGAIEALTVSLAAELSPEIRVNCIAPSLTETGMTKSITTNQNLKKAIESLHPIPKLGQPNDHSKLASFLLGESNKWITGQVFHIDGGRSTVRKKD
tara:strand:- start:362 stop:1084 length:723 start_codon:yes stop_codon:yes gene_type:complete